ncbi:uncharacterized protein TA11680 [Theileria annulata]|uniref:Hypothetical membrane protein, conserved n=1 Tax=Theileria annulata TaxID=5874 RepID=Q4UDM0_THEAN|nr:uncharacterized protein TA11680 [Theileria annulata]CAI74819.1 hypothetical membrane protein, conserved [Theileria annulata]|eukprot:XP_952551.1 hypothetical membrane protein, conserved [Theileria annulata]
MKIINIVIISFCLIKIWLCKAHYLDMAETEEGGNGKILDTQEGGFNTPYKGYDNYDLNSGKGDSLVEKGTVKSNNNDRKPKGNHNKKLNGKENSPKKGKEKVIDTKKKTNRKNNDEKIKKKNSKDSRECRKGTKCRNKLNGVSVKREHKKRNEKGRLVPIKSHNSFNEDFSQDYESKSESSTKKKLSPKIKNFAIGASDKIAQYGLPIATNLANNLINNKLVNEEEEDSESDSDLSDILGGKDDEDGDEENENETEKEEELESTEPEEDEENAEENGDSEEEYEVGEHDENEDEDNSSEEEEESDDNEEVEESEYANDEPEEHESEDEEGGDEEEDYTKRFKTPSGLEYLGAGYDLIKGNPLGDSVTLLDPGYKSSVIQMHWSKNIENISNSLRFLQPIGGWIRPYSSCHKVETVTEIKSSKSLLKSLSADASVSLSLPGDDFKFSASAKFKKLEDASKSRNSKVYINKSYCFKYVAGISTSLNWDLTLGFQSSLKRLSTEFKGFEKNSMCRPYIYREDPKNENCEELGVSDWMELFNTFGTHVATKIYLGGKIFTTLEVKKNQEKKLSDQGLDVKAILSAKIKDIGIDSNVEVSTIKSKNSLDHLLDTKKSTFVLGGDIYGHGKTIEFGEWARSVADHSMPIKAEFTPISHFIDKKLSETYNKAYLYYADVVLESDFLRYESQVELTPEELIDDVEIEHNQGSGDVKVSCKDGKSIQFGFMILSLKDNTYEVRECPIHATECSSGSDEKIGYSSLWIACRVQNIVNLRQILTTDKKPSCENGFHIFLGSYFFESKSKYLLMKPCKLGLFHTKLMFR